MSRRWGRLHEHAGQAIGRAIVVSFLLHLAVFGASILFLYVLTPKAYIPPSYTVKLVGQQPEEKTADPSPEKPQPKEKSASPKKQAQPKTKKAAAPKPVVSKKSAMPEMAKKQPVPPKKEAPPQPQTVQPPAAAQPATAASGTRSGVRTEGVALSAPSEDFQFPPYIALMHDKIGRNWNPPPGAQGIKTKVQFSILRSGKLNESKLLESSGNYYYDLAAMRAILQSDPFPPMPEGFFKSVAVFTVDLLPKD